MQVLYSIYYGATNGKNRNKKRKSDNVYIFILCIYEAKNVQNCPLSCLFYNAKINRRIEVNHNLNLHKQKAVQLLNSEEGLLLRSRRPIEPEALVGQTKSYKHYIKFRHFDNDKVLMDFVIFTIAFNIGKLYNKSIIINTLCKNTGKSLFFIL